MKKSPSKYRREKIEVLDVIFIVILLLGTALIVVPVLNMLAVSFTSQGEYMQSDWIFWPKEPTLAQYRQVFKDSRIGIGYKTTLTYIAIGVPLNILLSTMLAYGLSCPNWPGKKIVLAFVLLTMIFNGGIVPMYLTMKSYHLTDTIWAVILPGGLNTFNMILIYNYFNTLPISLNESARLDGANELTILFRIILPLAKPILATVCLFVMVQFWNEYFNTMIFLKSRDWHSLQQILRSIVVDADVSKVNEGSTASDSIQEAFSAGLKNAAVVVTMVPIMCVYPFLQKYFVKGVTIGAIKA